MFGQDSQSIFIMTSPCALLSHLHSGLYDSHLYIKQVPESTEGNNLLVLSEASLVFVSPYTHASQFLLLRALLPPPNLISAYFFSAIALTNI
jgi:hypothetical protein